MKKGLLIASLFCFSLGMMAQEASSGEVKGAHPYKVEENTNVSQEYAHWSLIPHVGFNSFDGDFTSEMKHSVAVPTAGVALEYNFTPAWSIGIEYMYDMYTVTGVGDAYTVDTLLHGHMHRAGGYLAMDFISLAFPRAQKKIVSIIPYVGGGVAWYRRAIYYKDDGYQKVDGTWFEPTHKRGITKSYINADGEFAGDYDQSYNIVAYLQAGLSVEFNLNRTLALGVRANYTYFTRDYVDGRGYYKLTPSASASKNNDGLIEVTANMRIKFGAVSKTHVRNISNFDTWEKKQQIQQPCHDTIIIRHDSIIVRETFEHTETAKEQETVYYVYFENNKSNLDDKALITIQQVADRLADDSTLYAVVTGYCDNTGSNKLNYALGDKRADNVMDELQAEHGIDSTRMHAQGLGKLIGRRSQAAYGPNRRAAIRLVDKETFERMKANLDEQRALREEEEPKVETPHNTVPLTESARKEKVNQYTQRENEKVVTDQSTTLSKLARKYYDNTYCWVYIYIANKDKIKNPNKLTPGIELTIPELTKQEMQITKDEGLVLYNNARLGK